MATTPKRKTSRLPTSPCLLPEPRHVELSGGTLSIHPARLIVIHSPHPDQLLFEAQEAQRALSEYAGATWHIHGSAAVPAGHAGLTIALDPGQSHAQGYTLEINDAGIRIVAPDPAGAFYGVMTLAQLLRQYGATLPLVRIEDYPDFPARGVMLDVSRDKVPTMKTLFDLVDLLAGLKINQLQLYTEHTFAYQRHPVVWANASPMTGEEILQLDAYCRARHVELVPNQNSFGHMRRWLTHDQYRPLAEAPHGCDTRWGRFDEPFTLCPGDPGSIQLVADMFEELLPHFSSRMFNVGCDETVDLGAGRSKADCEARGVGRGVSRVPAEDPGSGAAARPDHAVLGRHHHGASRTGAAAAQGHRSRWNGATSATTPSRSTARASPRPASRSMSALAPRHGTASAAARLTRWATC